MTVGLKEPDATDRKIVALLQDNARTPLVALAAAVGLSRSATQERLRRLERDGVIAQYTVRLGRGRSSGVKAWLAISFGAKETTCEKVVPQLLRFPEICVCHSVAGPVDIFALVEASSPTVVGEVRDRILNLSGIARVETTMVLQSHLERL
jgi:DNA-binding Lrp family transcriptional regulator